MIQKTIKSIELNREVDIYVYLPKNYNKELQYPVVYMHDGQNLNDPSLTEYGHTWQVEDMMNYKVKEVIIVGISSPQDKRRRDELNPYPNENSLGLGIKYLDFVIDVVRYIDETYSTLADARNRLLLGSSLGGHITTYAAAHYTDYFKNFACLSNAYWYDKRILNEIPLINNVKMYLDVGTNEGNDEYVSLNDQAYGLLMNEDSLYIKIPGAVHNEQEWAVRLPMIIRWFFGGRV